MADRLDNEHNSRSNFGILDIFVSEKDKADIIKIEAEILKIEKEIQEIT